MTIITAYKDTDGAIYLAADRATSDGFDIADYMRGKVVFKGFRKTSLAIASSGSIRFGTAFEHGFDWPKLKKKHEPYKYLTTVFVPAFRTYCNDNGLKYTSSEGEDRTGGGAIIIVGGRIFVLYADYSIIEYRTMATVGSGSYHAMGAMHILHELGEEDGGVIAYSGVTAACDLVMSCQGPIDLYKFGQARKNSHAVNTLNRPVIEGRLLGPVFKLPDSLTLTLGSHSVLTVPSRRLMRNEYVAANGLPDGLTVGLNGLITGSPTVVGEGSFTVALYRNGEKAEEQTVKYKVEE